MGLQGEPLVGESFSDIAKAAPKRRFGQGPVNDVPLRMAAAEAVGDEACTMQVRDG